MFNIGAQSNQMRRAIQHKLDNGEEDEVKEIALRAGAGIALVGALVAGGSFAPSPLPPRARPRRLSLILAASRFPLGVRVCAWGCCCRWW